MVGENVHCIAKGWLCNFFYLLRLNGHCRRNAHSYFSAMTKGWKKNWYLYLTLICAPFLDNRHEMEWSQIYVLTLVWVDMASDNFKLVVCSLFMYFSYGYKIYVYMLAILEWVVSLTSINAFCINLFANTFTHFTDETIRLLQ